MLRLPKPCFRAFVAGICGALSFAATLEAVEFHGQVTDAATGRPVAARIYLQRIDDGSHHFLRSASKTAAVQYDKQSRINPLSIERHTTVPAAPFLADLPKGRYRLMAERGKEYFPEVREFVLEEEPV